MMQSLSKLNSDSSPLFLDASVIINLVASDRIDEILKAIVSPIIIEKTVCNEFKHDPRDGSDAKKIIDTLVSNGRLTVVSLNDSQYETFLNLTGALPPDDIGDGEAATIACADGVGAAVIDERKAMRIATKDFSHIPLYSSLDLLCADCVFTALGKDAVISAVQDAINKSRMRVPHLWKNWIRDFLGNEGMDNQSLCAKLDSSR
jgi:predicted nucleic acid-binding protein